MRHCNHFCAVPCPVRRIWFDCEVNANSWTFWSVFIDNIQNENLSIFLWERVKFFNSTNQFFSGKSSSLADSKGNTVNFLPVRIVNIHHCKSLERLSLTFRTNGKWQKLIFCCLSSECLYLCGIVWEVLFCWSWFYFYEI